MPTRSISQLAAVFGLSRSALLYYDHIGLLPASGRTGSGYRYYTDSDRKRLERICRYREAGLSLEDIHLCLQAGRRPSARIVEKRLRQTADQIALLKGQEHLLAKMLRGIAHDERAPSGVDKLLWVQMLQAAGLDEQGRRRWHREFEKRAPEAHHSFLQSLGIPEPEIRQIRHWAGQEAPCPDGSDLAPRDSRGRPHASPHASPS